MTKKSETTETEPLKPADVQPERNARKGGGTKLVLDRIRAEAEPGIWYVVSDLSTTKSSASTASRLRRSVADLEFCAVGTQVLGRVAAPAIVERAEAALVAALAEEAEEAAAGPTPQAIAEAVSKVPAAKPAKRTAKADA